MPFDPLDHLDASLADFEHPSRPSTHSPVPTSHQNPYPPGFPFGYPSTHHLPAHNHNNHHLHSHDPNSSHSTTSSHFLKSDTDEGTTITTASSTTSDLLMTMASSTASAGGYSPPAWRRLGNGDRSSGFWRKGGDNLLGYGGLPPNGFGKPHDFDAEYDSAEDENFGDDGVVDDEDILAAAIRTRLPTGSMSPEKERSPEPEYARHHHQFHHQYSYHNNNNNNNNSAKMNGNGNGHAHQPDNDFRIKSEEPSAEDMKATLAALPQKDDPDNCKPLSPSLQQLFCKFAHSRKGTKMS